MTNIIIPEILTITEDRIYRFKELKQKEKEIKAAIDVLKEQLVNDYFNEFSVYKNTRGLVLATYLPYEEARFNTTQFKADHPDYFDMYAVKKTIYKFLPK